MGIKLTDDDSQGYFKLLTLIYKCKKRNYSPNFILVELRLCYDKVIQFLKLKMEYFILSKQTVYLSLSIEFSGNIIEACSFKLEIKAVKTSEIGRRTSNTHTKGK